MANKRFVIADILMDVGHLLCYLLFIKEQVCLLSKSLIKCRQVASLRIDIEG